MPDSSSSLPREIGPYRIERELGRGAFGVVYLAAKADQPDQRIALKVVESKGAVDRLLVEPQILSQLKHPHIVGLRDYFLEGTSIVMALEFIHGGDVKEALARRGRFTAGEVREMLRQMASALGVAHAAGICHRDIKLPNVMIEEQGQTLRFVLTDFGISRLAQGIQLSKRTGGTYQFMAPEQLRGRPGPQSDLWALGVMAYTMLTGQLPFTGATYEELSREILFKVPVPIRELEPGFADEELERIIFDLLEKPLYDRVPSAAELLKRLGAADASPAPAATPGAAAAGTTYESRLRARARRSWAMAFWSFLLLSGPYGFVAQAVSLAGVYLFGKSQLATKWLSALGWILLAWCVMGMAWAALAWTPTMLVAVGVPGELLIVLIGLAVLCNLIFGFAGVYYFAQARRIERELSLREALAHSAGKRDEHVNLFANLVQVHSDDVSLYQKFVELLLANGRTEEAVVEAKLLLAGDAYNVGGNLLLAQSYFDLGLYPQCVQVCEDYLRVTGYCFEFADLKAQCQTQMGSPVCIST